MNSIGNDIICWNHINVEKTKMPRFYSKIISPNESDLPDPAALNLTLEKFVWLLWSVKESAFKYQSRTDRGLLFSPGKILVQDIRLTYDQESYCSPLQSLGSAEDQTHAKSFESVITLKDDQLISRSYMSSEVLATYLSNDIAPQNMHIAVGRLNQCDYFHQSSQARNQLIKDARQIFNDETFRLEFLDQKVPVLTNWSGKSIPVSIAHHGYFYSYCWNMQKEEAY